jgi:AraC-like DNA-binding protein
MQPKEWSKIWHNARLDVGLLQAFYVDHAFPRHSHDYYVICVVKQGNQTFMHQGSLQFTPPGGAILINPGAAHTGEAADEKGFEMLCLYPTVAAMQRAAFDLTGRRQAPPFFREVRVDQPWLRDSIVALHKALAEETDALEVETRFTWTLAQLVKRYAGSRFDEQRLGRERKAVRQARRVIDERFAQGISLSELAEHVSLSPYYLLRVFRAEVGMPPHAYLESVRVCKAQRLIEAGKPLVEVAVEVGFSSQSHLTERFRQIVGVTPGRYAQQVRR